MSSLTEIANLALAELSESALVAITDTSKAGNLCRRFIYTSVREVLTSGVFKCARGPAELARLATAPTFGWAYAYQLPADYLRIVSFNEVEAGEQPQELFEIQGKTLLTDEVSASIIYVQDLTQANNDIDRLTPLVVKAVYMDLAAKLAWPLCESRSLKETLEQSAEIALRKAKAVDAREAFRPTTSQATGSVWLGARR